MRLRQRRFEEPHPNIAATLSGLAALLREKGQYENAAGFLRQALSILEENFSKRHLNIGRVQISLASVLIELNQFSEAEDLSRKALETYRELSPNSWVIHAAENVLGSSLVGKRHYEEGEALLLDSYSMLKKQRGGIGRERATRHALMRIIDMYNRWSKTDLAEKYARDLM